MLGKIDAVPVRLKYRPHHTCKPGMYVRTYCIQVPTMASFASDTNLTQSRAKSSQLSQPAIESTYELQTGHLDSLFVGKYPRVLEQVTQPCW